MSRLSFGRHRGQTLADLIEGGHIAYVHWLAGHCHASDVKWQTFRERMEEHTSNCREQGGIPCCCSAPAPANVVRPSVHTQECYYVVPFGKTVDEDVANLERLAMTGHATFWLAKAFKTWNECRLAHPDAIQEAQDFFADHCWHCGGRLVPIGHARHNGAAHDDWEDRRLHKKCWSEIKDM